MAGSEPPSEARERPTQEKRSSAAQRDRYNGEDSNAWHAPLSLKASSTVLDSLAESISVTTKDENNATGGTGPKNRLAYSHPSSSESLSPGGQSSPRAAAATQRHPLSRQNRPLSAISREPQPLSPLSPNPNPRHSSFWLRKRVLAVVTAAIMLATLVVLIVTLAFRASAVCPLVTVQTGKYAGTHLGTGITQWLGIRYAAPPTGDNRFSAPKDPESFAGVLPATKYAPGCPGMGSIGRDAAEDCLFLDIFAPSSATPDSKLPVFVWIQGGGFAAATGHTNGTELIKASGMNMITVSMTYRAGAFGFLSSKEVHDKGHLNNGLRDQRQALRWVQNNIRQFGGDPGHVTVGGQSAGAGSVLNHLTASNGTDLGLFHAAVLESQSMPPIRPFSAQQYQYDHLVDKSGCKGSSDTIACLRGLAAEDLIKNVVPEPFPEGAGKPPVFSYNPVIDGDFVTDLPVRAFVEGRFVKVPMIFGSVNDEGSIFTPHGLDNEDDATNFIKDNFPAISKPQLDQVAKTYAFDPQKPADPAAPGSYWHRPSLAYGEVRYTCAGLYLAEMATKHANPHVWSYHYNVLDPRSIASGNNVSHGSELSAVWGAPDALPAENRPVIPVVQGFWTSFIKHFDPNQDRASGAPMWEPWTGWNRLRFVAGDTAMENVTDAQTDRCKFWGGIAVDIME